MNFKNVEAPDTTITRNLLDFEDLSGNLYQSIVIIGRRSDQISIDIKEELNRKLEDFASYTDNLEEIFENREQIEISKYYESLPKSVNIAIQEFLDGNTYYRIPRKPRRFIKKGL
ncbi:MAG: RNA polymerase Rpb6 [Bacteroidales bacterium]|nr:RNA polymerase Rpb6 [Bacteroidales bacterium]